MVSSPERIPPEFRAGAQCVPDKAQETFLASPQDIALKGAQISDSLSTSLGHVQLRGARSIERLFGRTANRAVIEAAQTVARVLRQPGWPASLHSLSPEWKIIFLDESLPETQIPWSLISNCHPGWMTPPANIYIVSQRIAAGCDGAAKLSARDADVELMQVLLHEFGHVVEYHLLEGSGNSDRARAEGFATWFEFHAGDASPITKASARHLALGAAIADAGTRFRAAFEFTVSPDGYLTAAAPFAAIYKRRGVRGISDVYAAMRTDDAPFVPSVKKALGWSPERLAEETAALNARRSSS